MSTFFYDDLEYTTEDFSPILKLLIANPAEIAAYQDQTLKLCDILLARQAYSGAVEAFIMMCRVLAAPHTALGQ